MKKRLIYGLLLTMVLMSACSTESKSVKVSLQTKKAQQKIASLKSQLRDVNDKMDALPELEKDIFAKCLEGKEPTAENIRTCQESTQKQVFTLAQDLLNLKRSLKQKLAKAEEQR